MNLDEFTADWHEIDGHRVQVRENGSLSWLHDTKQPYRVPRHMVGTVDGATWQVINDNPLTLSPSLHCDASRGGCGRHGVISLGHWTEA